MQDATKSIIQLTLMEIDEVLDLVSQIENTENLGYDSKFDKEFYRNVRDIGGELADILENDNLDDYR